MSFSFLVTSKTRRLVIEFFCLSPTQKIHGGELARTIKLAPQLVHQELLHLEEWGFLVSSKQGNQRVFRLNKKFPYIKPLQDLLKVDKSLALPQTIHKTYNWQTLHKNYSKISVPKQLHQSLQTPSAKPRAYDEEILMKRKGLL